MSRDYYSVDNSDLKRIRAKVLEDFDAFEPLAESLANSGDIRGFMARAQMASAIADLTEVLDSRAKPGHGRREEGIAPLGDPKSDIDRPAGLGGREML